MKRRLPLVIAVAATLVIALLAILFIPRITSGSSESSSEFGEVLTIAYASDVQPFHFTDSNGKPAGIMVDIWNLWSEKTGVAIEFLEASWDESLQMVGSGKADVHAGLFFSEERDEYLDYGTSFVVTETHVFRHKSLPQINDVKELSAYRVGVLKGDYVESYLGESLSEENLVPFSTYKEMMETLKEGALKVFAADTPTGLYILKQNGLLSDFSFESEKPLYREKWHVAAGEGKDGLLKKMNEGFSLITEEEKLAIERKWTWSERTEDDALIIGIGRSFEPLAFINSLGQPSGLFVDMWREWSRMTGRPVEFKGSSWTETLEGLKSGSIDIHSGLSYTDDRAEFIDFSSQIYRTHTHIYHRPDEDQPESIDGYRDFLVGVQYGTYMDAEFRRAYPEIRIRNYSTGQDLIRALLDGEVYAAVHDTHMMDRQLDRLGLAGSIEYREEKLFPSTIHGGVRKGAAELLKEVNEGFSSISSQRLAELEKRWIPDPSERFFHTLSDEPVIGRISLTDEERGFLNEHPDITLGSMDLPPYSYRDGQGIAVGLVNDYLDLVNSIIGSDILLKQDMTSGEILSLMEKGEIDGLALSTKQPVREGFLNFTDSYFTAQLAVYISSDATFQLDSLADLSGKRVAVNPDNLVFMNIVDTIPDVIVVESLTLMSDIQNILEGKADAMIRSVLDTNFYMETQLITGLSIGHYLVQGQAAILYSIRKEWPELVSIINKALRSITPDEHSAIRGKWMRDVGERREVKTKSAQIDLTPDERAWLEAHPVITLGGPVVPPLDFVDEQGRVVGVGPDYMNLISEILGIQFEYETGVFAEILEKVKNKEIDGIRMLAKNEEREQFMNFTKSYTPFEFAIINPVNAARINSLDELSGRTLSVLNKSFDQNYVEENYPSIQLLPAESYEKGINMVINGEADAFLGALASASYLIETKMLAGIRLSSTVEELSSDFYMSVRKDWPEFIPILNKALDSITQEQHREIKSKWFALAADQESDKPAVSFSEEEKEFLRSHPEPFIVQNSMDIPPYNYNVEGSARGFSIDYIERVAEIAGIEIDFLSDLTWPEFLDLAKNNEIDILLNIARNDEREEYLQYTGPYINMSQRIVHSEDTGPYYNVPELDNKRVAVVKGYYTANLLKENYPQIEIIEFPDIMAALLAVARGNADAYIGDYAIINYYINTFQITGLVSSPPLEQVEFPTSTLHIAVPEDKEILRDIIDKAMSEISPQELLEMQEKWILTEESRQVDSGKASLFTIIIQISILVIVLLVLFFGIYFLTKQILGKSDEKSDFFSSGRMRSIGLVLLFILVTVILAMTYFGLNRIKNRATGELRKYARSILDNTDNSLDIWIDHNLNQIEQIAGDMELLDIVERHLSENRTAENLLKSKSLAELREYFRNRSVNFENEGFFIISPDRINIASRRDENLGLINLIEEQRPELLHEVFEGKSRFIPPIRSDVFIGENDTELPPTMFYASPVFNRDGDVIAVLTLRDDPMSEFNRFCELGRLADTGETYAFDEQGRLLTMSRFDEELKEMGLLDEGQISLLNITANEPDGSRPFTFMMRNAIQRRDGSNFEGYPDYRGKTVFGAWTWNSKHNFGLTTEIDADESLASYYTIRAVVVAILLVTLLLSIGATVLSIIIGQRANSALTKANDELEGRVESRTAQLKKSEERSQSLLEAAPDGMVIVNEKHIILQVNNQTEKMFGYSREELIGQEIEILVPEMKREGHVGKREAYIADPSTRAMGAIMEILAQRKDGSTFPADIGLSPIHTDEGLLVVSSVRDITERKRAEEDLRKLSTAVEQSPVSLVITDIDGNIEYVNPRFEINTGYKSEEVIGKNPRILNARVQPDEYYREMWKTISSGNVWEGEFCNLRKNGEKYWESASLSPIKNNSGEITHYVAIKEDITEQKKAAEELKQAQERLSFALSSARMGSWEYDVKENIFKVDEIGNEIVKSSSGKPRTRESWIGRIHPDDRERVQSVISEMLTRGEMNDLEYRIVENSGDIRWISTKGYSYENSGGEVEYAIGLMWDITDRKKSEEELVLLNQLVFGSLESADIGAWWVDFNEEDTFHALDTTADLIAMAVSEDKAYKISEWGEILVKTGELDPEYKKMIDDTFEQFTGAISGKYESYRATYPVLQLDGSIKWIIARAEVPSRKEDGSALLMTGTLIDITELKNAEDNVKKSEARLKLSTESAGIAVWEWFVPEDEIEASSLYYELFGFEPGQEKIAETWAARLHPDDKEETLKALSDHMEGKSDSYYSEFRYLHPKLNEYVWLNGSGKIVERNEDGSPKILMGINENINERKRMEIDILEKETEFRSIFESSTDAIGVSKKGIHVMVNQAYVETFGYDNDKEIIGTGIIELIAPGERDRILDNVRRRAMGEDVPLDYETRGLRKDGSEFDFELHISMYSIEDEQYTLVILRDITERKNSENEIKHINFMSDNALDLTRAGFWKIDYSNSEYYYSSPRAADIFGEPHNDEYIYHLTDEWLSRIIEADPAEAEATGQIYSDAVAGVIPRYDATYPYKRPKDGKIVWIRAIGDVIRDDKGQALFMYGVAQDITEVHDAENEIRMQHDQLLKIIEELPIPAAHWKLDGTILHLNKALTELLGYTIEDVPSVDVHFEKFYPDPVEREEYKKVWLQFMEEAAETGAAVKPLTLNATTKSGEVKNLLTHTIQIGDRALTLWVDFTERENYEKALEKAKITAEDATRAKSDFLANMSHEIRTPMNAIIGLSHLVQKTELSRKQDDYIQKISGSAHNLLGIINDILDFSKIEAGKLTMESIDFNLNEVFDNLGSMMGNKTRDKGLELIFDIATDIPPNLVGDPLRLGQILLNLTNNAVKFTEKGEIVVSVEIEEKDPREVMLKFKVRDTGIGLTEEQAGNLFQAFTQADTSTTRKFGGTGLGLSISKKLSEMMGGSIGVDSVYGEGATFHFSGVFQYRKAKKREVLPEEIRNLNVLIVDDNATSREVLTAYSRDFSFSSVAVANGQEAIKIVRETKEERKDPFDLILMDYMMPGLNGYETASKINEILVEGERPRYILVTSYGRDEILDAVDDAGFSGFILKPINQSIMFNTIVEAFGLVSEEDKKKKGEKFPDGFDLVRGAAVLLAEDNEINQQVAKEVLESEGFYVDIANNGREAVDMNRKKKYDIILMDLQMPVLDGYGATEEIRKDESYKDLSIVAMTADAMTGVRDNVLDVGMNDYITKPIDTSQLWKALVQWIEPGERELPQGVETLREEDEEETELFPVPGIDVVGGLKRVGSRKKLYLELLDKFKADFTDFESDVVSLLSEDKAEEAVRLVHTLKGVGANLGGESLADKAALLELAIKDNIEVETRLQAVSSQLQAIIAGIESSGNLDQDQGVTKAENSLSEEEIMEKIAEAVDSLKKRKPKPALDIFEKLEETKLPDKIADQIKECRTLLARYKMRDAVKILNGLIGADNV